MVEDVVTNPRAIGLLFAGSSTDAIANPINQVLSFLGRDDGRPVGARQLQFKSDARSAATNGDFLLFPLPVSKL